MRCCVHIESGSNVVFTVVVVDDDDDDDDDNDVSADLIKNRAQE